MQTFEDIKKKLQKLKVKGFVPTHRKGNTGIGKTIEDLLGIEENNVPGPDAEKLELKSARRGTTSMVTLFTKNPLPRGANTKIRDRFGYYRTPDRVVKELHSTLKATEFNTIRGDVGFKIDISDDRIEIVTSEKEVIGYWTRKVLKEAFERKYHRLMYVEADAKEIDGKEHFHFNEGWILDGFDFENFEKLLRKNIILVDIRLGKYSDGTPHDHGTGFRIKEDKLDLCFDTRKRVM